MIDEKTIQRINDAVNIVDVIKDFEPNVRKVGTGYQCLCPFHPDKNMGSFTISPKKNMCYCFSCEKGGDAVYYLMEGQGMSYPDALRYLGHKYDIEVEGMEKFKDKPKSKPRDYQLQAEDLPVFVLPMSMYERSTKGLYNDVLVRWIYQHHWDASQRGRIANVLAAYHIGTATTKNNEQFTIFWYLDESGNLCTGKMIRYKYNGHRMKKEDGVKNATDWIHAWLFRSDASPQYDREKNDWKRTYFGMHMIDMVPDATINTESPAWAIDRLSILALKIWHMFEQTQRTDASAEHIATCRAKLDVLIEQQNDLSTAIEQLLADIEAGRKYMKVYRQMKMYNDPATNPVLYKK